MVVPVLCVISLAVIACITVVHGSTCGTYTATDGSSYNLTGLTKALNVGYSISSGSYTYYFNLCDYYTTPQTQMYCYAQAPVYQISVTSLCYLLGTLPPKIIDGINGPDTGVTIVYTNEEDRCQFGTIPRVVNINVLCDRSKEAVTTLTEPSTCVYDISMTSPYACPHVASSGGSKGNGLLVSSGTLFLILLLVAVVIYIVGGMVFRYKFQEVEPGINLIPNLGFWTAIPGLVKDGCVFTYTKTMELIRRN